MFAKWMMAAGLVLAAVLCACNARPDVPMDSTRLAQIVDTARPSRTPTRTPSVTPPPTQTVLSVTLTLTSPDASGDPAAGQVIFNDTARGFQSCKTCHRPDSDARLIGPGLSGVRVRAASRVTGMSAEDYVRQSITDPAAFILPGYPNIMPRLFANVLSEEELADLVAYVLSLGE